jgi:beta-phosphoglucomutase-like phosphatase (HAD superfamily)
VLRGVIFDIDGTLVASNDAHLQSWVATLSEAGYDVPFDVRVKSSRWLSYALIFG